MVNLLLYSVERINKANLDNLLWDKSKAIKFSTWLFKNWKLNLVNLLCESVKCSSWDTFWKADSLTSVNWLCAKLRLVNAGNWLNEKSCRIWMLLLARFNSFKFGRELNVCGLMCVRWLLWRSKCVRCGRNSKALLPISSILFDCKSRNSSFWVVVAWKIWSLMLLIILYARLASMSCGENSKTLTGKFSIWLRSSRRVASFFKLKKAPFGKALKLLC